MSAGKMFFPLGFPSTGFDEAYSIHLKSVLTADESDFTPFNTSAKFTFSAAATGEDRKIIALWNGKYTINSGIITSDAFPDSYIELLRNTYGEDLPVPKKIIYGTTDAADAVMELKAGDLIGNLRGNVFTIQMKDKNDFYLNAYTMLELIRSKDLFLADASWDFPFSRINVSGECELVFNSSNATEPYVQISGGSFSNVIYNPPAEIPGEIYSFLSNDQIEIRVNNLNAGQAAIITIHDKSDVMYKTKQVASVSKNDANFSFTPQVDMKPHHENYLNKKPPNNHGKGDPGKSLEYSIEIYLNNNLFYETAIRQETRDIIRQEYVFHSEPFQVLTPRIVTKRVLEIPERRNFSRNNITSAFFRPDVFSGHNNYYVWLLNANQAIIIAEIMRRKYVDELLDLIETGLLVVPAEIATYDLKINSSWRNPERNEFVKGVQNSNHQFGRALDLASKHAETKATNTDPPVAIPNPNNLAVHYALFQAGRSFLRDLINLNTGANCRSLEVLLERNSDLLLAYTCNNAGVISMHSGSKYNEYVVLNPNITNTPTTEFEQICAVAELASHVHIGWNAPPNVRLHFPAIPSYGDIDITPLLPFKNVILVATEANDVAAADQLPLHHIANTIRSYLDALPDAVETHILEVSDPIEYLEALGAFNPLYKINYFFSLSHASQYGITLKHSVAPISDINLEERINNVYGTTTNFGSNELTEFAVNQFRVSNIRLLPSEMIKTLRSVFKKSAGIFVLGCKSPNDPVVMENTYCAEFASLVERAVYGGGDYSHVFEFDDSSWQTVNINRTDPYDASKQYVLVSDEERTEQFFKYVSDPSGLPSNFQSSTAVDLFEFYRDSLELVFPNPNFDYERVEGVEDLETMDIN